MISPGSTANETSATARLGPYHLVSYRTRTTGDIYAS